MSLPHATSPAQSHVQKEGPLGGHAERLQHPARAPWESGFGDLFLPITASRGKTDSWLAPHNLCVWGGSGHGAGEAGRCLLCRWGNGSLAKRAVFFKVGLKLGTAGSKLPGLLRRQRLHLK